MPYMLTTKDNPYDPRLDFMAWYTWDVQAGYNTCAYLARVTATADELPIAIQETQMDAAIDEIIEIHGGEIYKKLEVDATPPS